MNGRSLIPPSLPLNRVEGQRGVDVFNMLRLADVPGTPTMEEAGADWFRDIVRAACGSYDPVTKARMIRELFLLIPKKNSKTTNGALLMLTLMILNQRPRGQAIMTAPVRDVAQTAFDAIAGAIDLDPFLAKTFHVRDHKKTITHRLTKAELQIMTFDPETLTGQKVFAALIDELHVVAKQAKAPTALRQIRGGMMPFPEALLMFITTQSEEAPAGVFRTELNAARNVRDGVTRDGVTLPVLYEFPESVQRSKGAEWKNPALWPLVTPNMGLSIDLDRLIDGFRAAEGKGENELKAWGSQHLNIEIGVALRSDSWEGADFWEGAAEHIPDLPSLLSRCEVAEVGIDGGGLADMLGLSVVGRESGTGKWLVWTRSWIHVSIMDRYKELTVRLREFEADGDLIILDHMGADVVQLVDLVQSVEKAGILDRIGIDPHGVGGIVDALLASGFTEDRLLGVSQGWRLGGAIKTMERALAEGRVKHGGQALMGWCVGNAKVEPRGNAILITKQASGAGKIDPLMATFNAIHLIASNPQAKSKKYRMFVLGKGKTNATASRTIP